jgi:hypothetical protein
VSDSSFAHVADSDDAACRCVEHLELAKGAPAVDHAAGDENAVVRDR